MDPDPFFRGRPFPAFEGAPYPRVKHEDIGRLPADTWLMAQFPVGVRLEVVGDATALEIDYETQMRDLLREGAGRTFSAWRGGDLVDEQPATLGAGHVRLSLGEYPSSERAIVYLPDGMKPTVRFITPVGGTIEPAPPQPRWIAYGDSIQEGWNASAPALAWPHIVGRENGLDVYNLGYAGAARGEIPLAEEIAELPAEVISINHGTNCWTRVPYSVGMFREGLVAFLDIVRQGHPDTPLVVASPVVRPDAESTPNRLGATLGELRRTMEEVVEERARSDPNLQLLPGLDLIELRHLDDGIHPNDEGHRLIAAAMGAALRKVVT